MPAYQDPRVLLIERLEGLSCPKHIRQIVLKFQRHGSITTPEWVTLREYAQLYGILPDKKLDPEFEGSLKLWLRDLGLTIEDVQNLSKIRRAQRALEQEPPAPARVLVPRKIQGRSIQELRALKASARKDT